jgi:hypothetical protein
MDGDGKLEIISGCYDGEIYVYHRKPNGTYGAPEILRDAGGAAIKVGQATAVAVADWDGDGDYDLVIGTINGAVFLVRNEGTSQKPAFGKAEPLKADGKVINVANTAGPCIADWDGDGLPDLVLGAGSGQVTWYRNIGAKTKPQLGSAKILIEAPPHSLQEQPALDNPKRSDWRVKVSVADWNGDGRPDLLVGDCHSGSDKRLHGFVWVYLRNPSAAGTATANR